MKILWPIFVSGFFAAAVSHADTWSPEVYVQVESLAWHSDSTVVQVWLRKDPGGLIYKYHYNWNLAGHSLETAKALYSTLLTAQSTGRRVDLYGDHNGSAVWNNFSSAKIKD